MSVGAYVAAYVVLYAVLRRRGAAGDGAGVDFATGVPLRTLGSDGTGVGTLVFDLNFFLYCEYQPCFHLGNCGIVAGRGGDGGW